MKLTGRHFDSGQPLSVEVVGERIQSVEPAAETNSLPWIAPGLFDLQINGYGGIWFSDESLTIEAVREVVSSYPPFGVTRLLPTLITNSFDALKHGFSVIREACETDAEIAELVPGCHLEGPWISEADGPRGAHQRRFVRDPDWQEFQKLQDASGGRIRLVTLAPERAGAAEFVRRLVDSGVAVAIGHTAANADQIAAAIEAGARLSTHLGNGAHALLPRHPNYLWDQLADSRLSASLITDGFHIPREFIQVAVRCKSAESIIVTCDASGLAGLPPGVYGDGIADSEILEDGRIVVAGQRQFLAGSGSSTEKCVAHLMNCTDLSLSDAIRTASRNPADLLGLRPDEIANGARANLIIFRLDDDDGISIDQTLVNGVTRYQRPRSDHRRDHA